MSNILLLLSSPRGDSFSSKVARAVVDELRASDPSASLTVRDLAREPLPHVEGDFVAAIRSPDGPKGERQNALMARSDMLVDELLAADTLVIAAPMYNFAIPSTLKAWIDHVCRAGRTFRYTETGPEGLAKGKRAILVFARGGMYASGQFQAFEHPGPYLRSVLAFLGITDIETIDVEGIAYGPEAAAKAIDGSIAKASAIAARVA